MAKSTPAVAASPTTEPPASSKPTFDPNTEYFKGADLAAARRFADARQVFEEAARLTPMDASLAASVAIFGDLAANRISEDVVQRLFRMMQHANAQRWAEAHADVDEAIRLAPEYPRAHSSRGTLLLEQGKPADALKAFDQVVKLDPRFAEGYYNRGAARAALNQYDAAIADYTRAIELQSDFWHAYTNRGTAHLNRAVARENGQDAKDALADFNKAHELNPGAIEPLYQRGLLYALAEEWNAAVADFTVVIERDGQHTVGNEALRSDLQVCRVGRDDRRPRRAVAGGLGAVD